MPDRNITSAIFELKDQKRSSKRQKPKRQRPPTGSNIRRRSFDPFYFFATMLLGLATFAQIGAIIAFR